MRNTRGHRASHSRGFTLIELMISIALVLLLMVGVNQVFKITGETVSVSQTLADAVRDARAAQQVMSDDVSSMVNDGSAPCLVIQSARLAAFKDRADELGDRDYQPGMTNGQTDDRIRSIDFDGDNQEDLGTGNTNLDNIPRAIYGIRNRRVDQISFFARGNYRRQTGNDGAFVGDMGSTEAWIWYGHIKQPGPTNAIGSYTNPGTGIADGASTPLSFQTNPNNWYSSQWMLGRMVMLLRAPDASGNILDDTKPTGVPQKFIPVTAGYDLSPLGQRSLSNDPSPTNWEVQWARYDLAGTTISDYKNRLTAAIAGGNTDWYFDTTVQGRDLSYRFQGSMFPDKPLSSEGVARISLALLQHCSQFIVEYAGDFLTQDDDPTSATYGRVQTTPVNPDPLQALKPDGKIDFVVNPLTKVKSIRWYGLPRDTSSNSATSPGTPDGVIDGALSNGASTLGNNGMPDVVPLRDVALTANPAPPPAFFGFPFERDLQSPAPNRFPAKNNYASRTTSATNGVALTARYNCVWGPDLNDPIVNPLGLRGDYPKLIRFIFTIDDPSGRIPDGQTYEYVFKVGP